MLFQGGALFDSMTVEQNVRFPLTMFTSMTREEKLDRVNFCLQRVNLENALNSTFFNPPPLTHGHLLETHIHPANLRVQHCLFVKILALIGFAIFLLF